MASHSSDLGRGLPTSNLREGRVIRKAQPELVERHVQRT